MTTSRRGSRGREGNSGPKRGIGRAGGGAQRRLVTVLFCDLAGSAELASRIDPEDMRDVLHAYLNAFAAQIETAGGFIARYMGDGILAYFGYPLAREGDPARAVRAALAVAAAAGALVPPHGHRLSVRCGVATGLTVVGDLLGKGPAMERGVTGAAPNLAARLQAAAAPGETMICQRTAGLVTGLFDLKTVDGLTLKGFEPGGGAFRVVAAAGAGGPLAERLTLRRAPLAGRMAELEALRAAWRRACGGRIVFAPVTGEAGIGKSRLIYEFQHAIAADRHLWFEAAADPAQDGAAYAIARRLVRAPRGREETALTAERLGALLARAGLPADALPLLSGFLGLTREERELAGTGAEDRRRLLHRTLVNWLLEMSRTRPSVLVIEDLQWADPSSVEVLQALLGSREQAPLLVIGSARGPLGGLERLASAAPAIRLGRLADAAVGSIVRRLAGPDLAPAGLAALVRRSDGNPLFAEELAAHVAGGSAAVQSLPDTLTGLLTARLDATGPAASLARVASVLGPVFDAATLQRFARLPARLMREELAVLGRAELITTRGAQHAFRHALIHEAAYASLLKDDRRALHRRAAALMMRSGGSLDAAARHWREAGDLRRAADAYRSLARSYVADSAYGEAVRAYRAALDVVGTMPASVERDREEMDLSSALTNALQVTDGYSAPAVAQSAAHARALAERVGDSARLFNQIAAEWMAASSAADYALARELAARAMPVAAAAGGDEILGTAFMMQTTSAYRVGALAEGEAAFRAGARHFRAAAFVRRPGAVPQTLGNGAVNAWLLGHGGAARRRNARVIAHGDKAGTPFVRAFSWYMAAMTLVLMDEPAEAARLAGASMAISDAEGFPQFAATSRIVLGRALAMQGRRRAGIALIQSGLEGMKANRSQNGVTMYLTWLAQCHVEGRDKAAARSACDAALGANPAERFFRAETLRVRALAAPRRGDAASYLAAALELARSTGAGWVEARVLETMRQPGVSGRS